MSGADLVTSGAGTGQVPEGAFAWYLMHDPGEVTRGNEELDPDCVEPGPIEDAWAVLQEISDQGVLARTAQLLDRIETAIRQLGVEGKDASSMPPLRASVAEDGSVLLEWVAKSFRVGFGIGVEPDDASWYLAPLPDMRVPGADGQLGDNSTLVVKLLVEFVLGNT